MCCKGFYTNGYCSMGHLLTPIEIENCYLIPDIRIKNKHRLDLNFSFQYEIVMIFIEKKSHDTISNLLCFPSYRTFVLISVKASFRTIIYWQAALSEWYRIKRVKIKKNAHFRLEKIEKKEWMVLVRLTITWVKCITTLQHFHNKIIPLHY